MGVTVTLGKSSFLIMPIPSFFTKVALTALVKRTVKASLISLTVSPLMVMGRVWVVCPGVKVIVPVLAT